MICVLLARSQRNTRKRVLPANLLAAASAGFCNLSRHISFFFPLRFVHCAIFFGDSFRYLASFSVGRKRTTKILSAEGLLPKRDLQISTHPICNTDYSPKLLILLAYVNFFSYLCKITYIIYINKTIWHTNTCIFAKQSCFHLF